MEKQLSFLNSSPPSLTIYADGACKGNPGPAGCGIYILDEQGLPFIQEGFFIGKKTNNQAEYLAVALALALLKSKNIENVFLHIKVDSLLLARHLQGAYKVREPHLLEIFRGILVLLTRGRYQYKVEHVLRQYNTKADSLANKGVSMKQYPSSLLLNILSDASIFFV